MIERKLLITSIFITLGAIAFLSGYLLMPERDLNWQTGTFLERFDNKVEVGLTENKALNIAPLSGRKILSFVNPPTDSQKIIAVDNSGNVVEIDLPSLNEKVLYTGQTGIVEAVLSPAGDSIIYSFYNAGNAKKYSYLNFRKGESTDIVGDVRSAAFSPHGDQAVYLVSNDGGGELLISKGGNIIKRALKTRLGVAVVDWPADFISIISYDKDDYGELFVLKEDSELNKILSYQYDLAIKWSPSGEKFLFSTKESPSYHGQVTIGDHLFYKDIANNEPSVPLDADVNASKCVWSNDEEIICGIKNQTQAKDEFYKISLKDGSKILVSTLSINLLTKELALSRSGDTIFVLNDIDGKLSVLKLQK